MVMAIHTQINEKQSKRNFVFAILYSVFILIFSFVFPDGIGTYIAYVLSVFIYIPIIYLIVMFAQQRKKHEYDFSLRGYLINWMLIVCSSIGLVSFLYASYANTLFSPIFYLGLPLFIAIPFLITFIVLSSQNLLTWKKLKDVDPYKYSMDNYKNTYKKVTLSFIFSLIYSVYSSLFVFSFVTLGQYYDIINKIDLKHILASFVLQIILIVVSIIVAIVLIKKIINKDFNKSKLNSFIAIGTLATSCVSLMICGLTFGLLFSMYNFLETIVFWIPFMVNLFVILVLVVISLIYLIKYFKTSDQVENL